MAFNETFTVETGSDGLPVAIEHIIRDERRITTYARMFRRDATRKTHTVNGVTLVPMFTRMQSVGHKTKLVPVWMAVRSGIVCNAMQYGLNEARDEIRRLAAPGAPAQIIQPHTFGDRPRFKR